MKKPTFIQQSLSSLIVFSIVAMHTCSVTCAFGIYSCCSEMKPEQSNAKQSCCNSGKQNSSNDDNCQKDHLAFFHTFGKSSVTKADQAIKVFPRLMAELMPFSADLSAQQNHTSLDYVIFHPPPPSGGMQILTSSFLI